MGPSISPVISFIKENNHQNHESWRISMEKKKVDELMKDFYQEYQEDPSGWSFWMSPPPESDKFYEAYIIHGDEAFFLKLDSIFSPNPVGIGTKLEIERDQLVKDLPDFGYRKFSRKEVEKFLKNIPKPEDYKSKSKFFQALKSSQNKMIEKALDKNPTRFEPIEEPGELAAIGPYSSESPLDYVSEKQKQLRKDLSKKLNEIINREYPGYY
ncbi:hypothetical protein AKJ38_03255 [candidate division MSBL1 archaeon SCGC-AAA259I14]|uniref:Uncharacterized protein n=1 Tax=candidate division MSBL1 archaeon SCGC-AAA259I14 TaxID=1698268 RepID=A0A133UQD0_9EURY|nr:hypothetical protein AKJ38_03255 [candidate division MSBL1 archaeon SCGC-AAA259I14]